MRFTANHRRIRNIGIIAHVDAGKTTLSERILLYTGRIHRAGEVHDGGSTLDDNPLEKAHGITINAAAVSCPWQDHQLNLIDTPGHVDFTIEVERALRVLDGAVCVFDGVAGVEAQSETVWRQADRHGVPRLCFVNKLDRAGADLDATCRDIRTRLGARPVVLTFPIGAERELRGVVDVVRMRALVWDVGGDGSNYRETDIPDDLVTRAARYRDDLLSECADHSDEVAEAVLADRPVPRTALVDALRRAVANLAVVPVLSGSAYKNIGVQPLLDAVVDLLPAPEGTKAPRDSEGVEVIFDPAGKLAALCFKVAFDRHGQTTFVRVYRGRLTRGTQVFSARLGRTVRVARLVKLFGNTREEVDGLVAGDIGAIVGAPLAMGDTLTEVGDSTLLERIETPPPLVRAAIEPVNRSDEQKLGDALHKLVTADPSLRVGTDGETGQRQLSGMGELHLAIAIERLADEHGVRASIGRPRVAYRQTLAAAVERDYTLKKQSGGPGMFARIKLRVGPGPAESGLSFADQTRGGAVPADMVRGVEIGVREAMARGIDGIPLTDIEVVLVDGETHVKDSSELAFKIAGHNALAQVASENERVVLEPTARLSVTIDEAVAGAVLGDLARRRGTVLGVAAESDRRVVSAIVPVAEVFGYAGALSSLTGGRGQFALTPADYQPVPTNLRLRAPA